MVSIGPRHITNQWLEFNINFWVLISTLKQHHWKYPQTPEWSKFITKYLCNRNRFEVMCANGIFSLHPKHTVVCIMNILGRKIENYWSTFWFEGRYRLRKMTPQITLNPLKPTNMFSNWTYFGNLKGILAGIFPITSKHTNDDCEPCAYQQTKKHNVTINFECWYQNRISEITLKPL